MGLISGLLTLPLAPVRGHGLDRRAAAGAGARPSSTTRAPSARSSSSSRAAREPGRSHEEETRRGRGRAGRAADGACAASATRRDRWPTSRDERRAVGSASSAEAALATVEELTGLQPRGGDRRWSGTASSWTVTVDVLELERIPNTTDVMGAYVVQLDEQRHAAGLPAHAPLPARRRPRRRERGRRPLPGRPPANRAPGAAHETRPTWPTSSSACSTRASSSPATSRSTCSTSSC